MRLNPSYTIKVPTAEDPLNVMPRNSNSDKSEIIETLGSQILRVLFWGTIMFVLGKRFTK
jgi:hypothetical protein